LQSRKRLHLSINLLHDCTMKKLSKEMDLDNFECTVSDLTEFFRIDSFEYNKSLLGKSYCFTLDSEPSKIICAFTLSNDSLFVQDLDKKERKEAKGNIPYPKNRHPSFPAVKIGRLGVDKNYTRIGIGSQLMNFIKAWFADDENKTGCRFITVDAYNKSFALDYYTKNGFNFLIPEETKELEYYNSHNNKTDKHLRTRSMYFDLIQIVSD